MAFGIVTLLALAAAVVLLVRLHALRAGLSPVRDAVSDYGTTRWHALYRSAAGQAMR